MVAVVSAGQRSIRQAVQQVLPTTPHQRCHFHDLREAAKPRYEADRHAKKALKKCVRGVRPACTPTRESKRPRSRPHLGLLSRHALTDAGSPPWVASGRNPKDMQSPCVTFRKIPQGYWPGLFHCYHLSDLLHTHNKLEPFFGAHRYYARRTTGRQGAVTNPDGTRCR